MCIWPSLAGKKLGLSESRKLLQATSLPPTGLPAFLSQMKNISKNSRDAFGDGPHSLPVNRGCVSLLLGCVGQQEPDPGGFGRNQRLVLVLRVSEGS